MGTTTTLRVTSEGCDPRLLFLMARKVVGIPDEWPFHDDNYNNAAHVVRSEPGGFAASVAAYWNEQQHDPVPWDDEDQGPSCYADVWWDTSPSLNVRHDEYVAAVGAWLDSIGVAWCACFDGEWLSAA